MEKERTYSLTNQEMLDLIKAVEVSMYYHRSVLNKEKTFELADLHTKLSRQFVTSGVNKDAYRASCSQRSETPSDKGSFCLQHEVC